MRLCFILDGDDYSDDAFDEDKVSSIVIWQLFLYIQKK